MSPVSLIVTCESLWVFIFIFGVWLLYRCQSDFLALQLLNSKPLSPARTPYFVYWIYQPGCIYYLKEAGYCEDCKISPQRTITCFWSNRPLLPTMAAVGQRKLSLPAAEFKDSTKRVFQRCLCLRGSFTEVDTETKPGSDKSGWQNQRMQRGMFIKGSEKAKRNRRQTENRVSHLFCAAWLLAMLLLVHIAQLRVCNPQIEILMPAKNRQDNILKFSSHVSPVVVCFSVRLLDFSI